MKEEFKTTIYADTIEGKLGLGVDYYKGETGKSGADEVYIGAEPPTDPQVKLWVDTEAQSVGAVDWNDVENKPNFATVAESGSYNDLTDKPTIPEAPDLSNYATKDDLANAKPDLTPYAKTADLSTVATSGSYEDLTNKPNLFNGNYEDLTNKPNLFSGDYQDLTNKPNLFDGDYNNLTNKPTIPEPYILPTASTTTLGGVKVDGSTITIADGVISSAGGGSSLENTFDTNDDSKRYVIGYDANSNFGWLKNMISDPNAKRNYIQGDSNRVETSNNFVIGQGNNIFKKGNTTILGGYNNSSPTVHLDANIIIGGMNSNYNYSPVIGGYNVMVGQGLVIGDANNYRLILLGDNNLDAQNDYLLLVGNGKNRDNRSNALSLDRTTGNLAIAGTMSSAGADYAEFFEWKDGNPEAEDRVGYIVSLDGDKLILANEGDYILGVVSGTATVLGDNPEWNWAKRWITDDFGRIQYEDKVIHHEAKGDIPAWDETIKAPVVNPDYDPDQKYIKRADRPEWSAVGMMGKLYVRDDGTCQVNGFAKPINGVATASTSGTMRVIERVSDNVIRVVIK